MSAKPNDARSSIADDLKLLQTLFRRKPDPYMMLLQVLFDAKSNEWTDIFSASPPEEKKRVQQILKEIDPSNISKYENM
jgi:hypothetical protein